MMSRIGNRLYAVIGLIAAVVTIAPWALSNTVRVWVKDHSNWLYGTLVLAALAVVALAKYATDLNRENRELKAASKKPSVKDTGMLREILALVPRDGSIMIWLKTNFFVKKIPAANMEAVDQVCQKLSMNPLKFDNQKVNDAYKNFKAALEDFSSEITQTTSFVRGSKYQYLHVSLPDREDQEESYYRKLTEIKEVAGELISAYDEFLKTCSTNGLDIYNADAS